MQEVITKLRQINRQLRHEPTGLYFASLGEHYRKYCWWRDIFYQVLPNLTHDPEMYIQTMQTFINYLHKYEWKIDNLTCNPWEYNAKTCLHARTYPDLTEVETEWGNMQMDAYCLMLYGITLGENAGLSIIRGYDDRKIIQKVIYMYQALHYWELAGNDAWEENVEVHAHALGAAKAAMIGLRDLGFEVNGDNLWWCSCNLNNLLPKESHSKECDLALLQLIYPLNVVTKEQRDQILCNVENRLLRRNGVIRYPGDVYYNVANRETKDAYGGIFYPQIEGQFHNHELQWSFGFAYLAIIYNDLGKTDRAKIYLDKLLAKAGDDSLISEGIYANPIFDKEIIKNDNTPLGWANALAIIALEKVYENN